LGGEELKTVVQIRGRRILKSSDINVGVFRLENHSRRLIREARKRGNDVAELIDWEEKTCRGRARKRCRIDRMIFSGKGAIRPETERA